MSRQRRITERGILPDPRFQDILVTKCLNTLMRDGKKAIAEKIFYEAMKIIEKRIQEDPLKIFKKALGNIRPAVEVKSRRIGGATYQIPVEVKQNRRQSLALRWLRDHAKKRSGRSMTAKFADEIMDAAEGRGGAAKKREDVYKMAEANKAFAHLKW